MKLIVGLGNPGAQYRGTRHNVGYEVVDRLKDRYAPEAIPRSRFHSLTVEARLPGAGGGEEACLLMKPTTYMNRSGQSIGEAVRFYKVDPGRDLLVLVDDINLTFGGMRIRAEGGAGGHNGLANIQQMLSTPKYARLRIGIDEPGRIPQSDYVLGRFTPEERQRIDETIEKAADAAALWAREGAISAMNEYNVRQTPPRPAQEESKSGQGAASETSRDDAAPAPSAPGDQGERTEP